MVSRPSTHSQHRWVGRQHETFQSAVKYHAAEAPSVIRKPSERNLATQWLKWTSHWLQLWMRCPGPQPPELLHQGASITMLDQECPAEKHIKRTGRGQQAARQQQTSACNQSRGRDGSISPETLFSCLGFRLNHPGKQPHGAVLLRVDDDLPAAEAAVPAAPCTGTLPKLLPERETVRSILPARRSLSLK